MFKQILVLILCFISALLLYTSCGDCTEIDPTALTLNDGGTTYTIEGSSTKVFSFVAPINTTYTIAVTSITNGDLGWSVGYNENYCGRDELYLQDAFSDTSDEVYSMSLNADTYMIVVYQNGVTAGDFTIEVTN